MTIQRFKFIGIGLLLSILTACSSSSPSPSSEIKPEEPQDTAGMFLMSPQEVEDFNWEDDGDYESIAIAVEQSIRYYNRLPERYQFTYGDQVYSAREMERSHELFLQILETFYESEHLFWKEVKSKFHFYETRNNDGRAFFTGYYEPLLKGNLEPSENFSVPLYALPEDLVTAQLDDFYDEDPFKGKRLVGRVQGSRFIPYDERKEIAYQNSLHGRAEVIAYVDNDIELFFLQIQGSGLVEMPDGQLLRVNYAGQNGRPYRAIGRLLLDKIPRDQMSLQTIKAYLYENPRDVRRILNYNPSYTFFRVVDEGPLGNIEVPLTPGRSLAMDRKKIPRGGLAFIQTEYPPLNAEELETPNPIRRFMAIQDTGGAIRGHGRADIFWGHGHEAEIIAGNMKQHGRIVLFVAKKEFISPDPISTLNMASQ